MSEEKTAFYPHSCLGCLTLLLTGVTITGITMIWKYPLMSLDSHPPEIYQILLTLSLVLIWFLTGLLIFLVHQVQRLKTINSYRRILDDLDPLAPRANPK